MSSGMAVIDPDIFGGVFQWRRSAANGRSSNDKIDSIEYLFDDEYKTTGPTMSARVCYGVGNTYVAGLATGGLWGAVEGLRNRHNLNTFRLRLTVLLNALTSRGPFVGNNAAALALLYNGLHGVILAGFAIADSKGSNGEGMLSRGIAGGLAGAVFRASKGLRSAGRGAAVASTAMMLYSGISDYFKHGRIYIQ